jgi:hypothetical protein
VINNNWTSRIIEKGSDPYGMGRWSYVILRGQDGQRILLVTAYRVCIQATSSAGPTTSTSQQFRFLSREFRAAEVIEDPQPRKQFIIDLQDWLEYQNTAGCFIILALDSNEGLGSETGKYHPLDYTLDKPIPIKGHDGTIKTLVRTCGLCNPLSRQHTETSPPPTYQRGKERIDYIFVSVGLLPSVTKSGFLPYNQYFIADHRPCYLDFNSHLLFGNESPTIAPSQYQGLQLHDQHIIQVYEKALLNQIDHHKLETKINDLLLVADTKQWTEEHTKMYETLDTLMTESMISVERKASKKYQQLMHGHQH